MHQPWISPWYPLASALNIERRLEPVRLATKCTTAGQRLRPGGVATMRPQRMLRLRLDQTTGASQSSSAVMPPSSQVQMIFW